MTDPMTPERLAEIEARAEAATEGPWEAWDRGIGFEVHVDGEALNSELRETFRQADAEFIAASRTDVPALVAALRAVLDLHRDAGHSQGFFPGDRDYGERDHCCGTCGTHGEYGVEWPCPTVQAVADALEVEP